MVKFSAKNTDLQVLYLQKVINKMLKISVVIKTF